MTIRDERGLLFPFLTTCAQHWVIHYVTFDPKNYIKKMRQLAKKHSAGMAAIFKTIHGRLWSKSTLFNPPCVLCLLLWLNDKSIISVGCAGVCGSAGTVSGAWYHTQERVQDSTAPAIHTHIYRAR